MTLSCAVVHYLIRCLVPRDVRDIGQTHGSVATPESPLANPNEPEYRGRMKSCRRDLGSTRSLGLVRKVINALEKRQQLGTLGFTGLVDRLRRAMQEFVREPARAVLEN